MKEHRIRDSARPSPAAPASARRQDDAPAAPPPVQKPGEIGGRDGPEPTRYGDWEVNGRCTDF